jgi:lyso-ornithine lipid O-acyltransferase
MAITRTGAEVVPVGLAYADGAAESFDEPFAVHAKRLLALPEVRVAIAVGEPFAVGEQNLRAVNRCAQDVVQDLSRAAL